MPARRRIPEWVTDYLPSWAGFSVLGLIVVVLPCLLCVSCWMTVQTHLDESAVHEAREREAEDQRKEYLRTEGSAVVRAFLAGQFRDGASLADLLTAYPADGITEHGAKTEATYDAGHPKVVGLLRVSARGGRLVGAVVTVRRGPHKGTLTVFGEGALEAAVADALLGPAYERGAAFKLGLLAVVGFGATIIPDSFPIPP